MPSPRIDEAEFRRRFLARFIDPAFEPLGAELDRIANAAWDAYFNSRKSPHTKKAGDGFADPNYDLADDWRKARDAIHAAQALHDAPDKSPRILIINASPRTEHTCPGEMSKTWRLVELACDTLVAGGASVERLDLSRTVSEYGRAIHPCKACFSTSASLCHWPCSCYPNYSLGQTDDWMNAIYPRWVEAHGVMIVTPVHWYAPTSPLKLMMDRLVCADGGNPDPTSTHGKHADEAKRLELKGWAYPKHLAGRIFSVVVHGDAEGATEVRRALHDWLASMDMIPAGPKAELDRYIGYYEPYATSHDALDRDLAIQEEVRNCAHALLDAAHALRAQEMVVAGEALEDPRPK